MAYQVLEGTEVRPIDFSGASIANSIRSRAIEDARNMYQLALMGIQAGLPVDQAAQFQQIGNDILLRYFALTPDMKISPQTSYDYVPREFASANLGDAIKMLNYPPGSTNTAATGTNEPTQNSPSTNILDPNYNPPGGQQSIPSNSQPQSLLTPQDLTLTTPLGQSLLDNPFVFGGNNTQTPSASSTLPITIPFAPPPSANTSPITIPFAPPPSVNTNPIPNPPTQNNKPTDPFEQLSPQQQKELESRIRSVVPKLKKAGIPDEEIEKWVEASKRNYAVSFGKTPSVDLMNYINNDASNLITSYKLLEQVKKAYNK